KEVPIGNVTEANVTTVEGTAFGTTGKGDVTVMDTGTSKTTIIDAVGNTKELKPGETVPLKPGDTVMAGDPPHAVGLPEGPPTIPAPPPEIQPSLGPGGESIKLGAKEYGVKYSSGDSVLLEKVSQPLPPESAHPISAQQLKEEYVQVGDSQYYYKKTQDGQLPGDRQIYKIDATAAGGIQIHEDPNMQLMQKDQFLKKSGGKPPES